MSETADTSGILSRLIDTEQAGTAEHALQISERPHAMVQVKALGGQREVLRAGLKSILTDAAPNAPLHATITDLMTVVATGPKEFWCYAPEREPEDFSKQVAAAIGGAGAIYQQSDARTVLTLTGTAAEDVLAKGCAVDFHTSAFPAPGGCLTVIEMVPALIVKRDTVPTFDVAVPVSYAEGFLDWLTGAAQDVGYRVALV